MHPEMHPNAARLKESLNRYEKMVHRRVSPIEGLTRREFDVLLAVAHTMRNEKPGLRAGEIVEALDITPPSVTPLIDRLEQQGLIERQVDPDDRRVTVIVVTVHGGKLLHEAIALIVSMYNRLGEELGENAAVLADLLDSAVDKLIEIRQEHIKNGLFPLKREGPFSCVGDIE